MLEAWPVGCPTIIFFLYCCSQVILFYQSDLFLSYPFYLSIINLISVFISINNLINLSFPPPDCHWGEELGDTTGNGGGKGENTVGKIFLPWRIFFRIEFLPERAWEKPKLHCQKAVLVLKRWRRVTDLTKHNLYQNMHFQANNPCDKSHSAIYRQYIGLWRL